jgi:biotin synthase
MIPKKIRASIGTAAALGLTKQRMDVLPTTAYLMLYTEDRCIGNCAFCPQARESTADKNLLSRILWPVYPLEKIFEALEGDENNKIERICLQVINYPGFFEDVKAIINEINTRVEIPISLDTSPLNENELRELHELGLERIGIPIDAATEELFNKIKGREALGPYTWQKHLESLKNAVKIFGQGNVMSNIILGLGETEEEAITTVQELADMNVPAVLFAFTPIAGTKLREKKQPDLSYYRRAQVARALILDKKARIENMRFTNGKLTDFGLNKIHLMEFLKDGVVFQTTGCPGCNRPYYNERPSGPLYNYPRPLTPDEVDNNLKSLGVDL